MQVYANSNRLSLNTFFFFIIVLILAFLPVSTFLFFLKNDAFNGYFPPKFFMSESIHAGHLPLWNPYINYGIPQYGDMSSGYWSPVTWLIASTVGYNAYTLTLEVLFYILLGGIGMYKLTGLWKLHKEMRIIAAVAFMCCGYNVAHLQHFNWLSGAAFLPWCFWSYANLLNNFSWRNAIINALLFYILVASAHPGITICAAYFFAAILVFHFIKNEAAVNFKTRIKIIGKANAVFLLLFLLLSTGIIAGYLDILPYFGRGEKIQLKDSLGHPANLQSWISSLLPLATVKNDSFYNTDLTMRNSYFSLTLLLFFFVAVFSKKNSLQKFLLVAGTFFALLSSGGIFKSFAYKFIPLIGYVRLNGEFRIFSILCFIIIAIIALNRFAEQNNKFEGVVKWVYYSIEIILFGCIIYGMYNAFSNKESILFNLNTVVKEQGLPSKLKSFIDTLSFNDTIWMQAIIQLFILWGIKWCLRYGKWNVLKRIVVADMIIACLLNIPFTGVGKASVAQVQAVLNKSPKGIPTPALQPLLSNDTLSTEERGLVGDWSMYNKQIGVKKEVLYPIALKNSKLFFEKTFLSDDQAYLDQPFLFTPGSNNNISVNYFSPSRVTAVVYTDTTSTLVLKQNFYPHWFYKNTVEKKPVNNFGINFMSAPLIKGKNEIVFSFEPTTVKWAMLISLLAFIGCCVLLILLKPKLPYPS